MSRSVGARFITGLMLGTLWLTTAVAPAAAAQHTRWVDDDNHPGDGPAKCNSAGFSSIQDAIDASNAGDRVFVCPGNYTEQLVIDVPGLEVRSVVALAAKIWPPETLVFNDFTALVTIDAPSVTLRGFRMNILAGDINVARPNDCEHLDVAIWIREGGARVLGNHIKTLGDYTFVGACGYDIGILVDDNSFGGQPPSFVWRNWITDFKYDGIFVTPGSSGKLWRNGIRYVHLNDPLTCHLVPVLGINPNPSAIFPECEGVPVRPLTDLEARAPQQVDGLMGLPVGILVEGGWVNARANSIYSTLDTQFLPGIPEFPLVLVGGMVLLAPAPDSHVDVNRIDNAGAGLVIIGSEVLGPPIQAGVKYPSSPNGGVAANGNRLSENVVGLLVVATDGSYYANRSHINIFGSLVFEGGNIFSRNDFRYNDQVDCDDETSGAMTSGTDNDWEDVNLGLDNYPSDLCFNYWIGDL